MQCKTTFTLTQVLLESLHFFEASFNNKQWEWKFAEVYYFKLIETSNI